MFSPAEIGLPDQFTRWRLNQWEAVNYIVDSPQRFVALCAPTGFGKSLTYMTAAYLSGKRTVVLTSTKGLQDQIQRDFATLSTDIRGMMNYPCVRYKEFGTPPYTKVADAACQSGASCQLRSQGCGYYDLYRLAQRADIVVTNYQCWLYDQRKREQLDDERPVEMLILDECHDAQDQLASYLSVELQRRECLSLGTTWPMAGYDQEQWKQWALHWWRQLDTEVTMLRDHIRRNGTSMSVLHEIKEKRELMRKLEVTAGMQGNWVIEEQEIDGDEAKEVKFDPLWPKEYAEKYLFRGVGKVVLVSATVREKSAQLLGVPGDQLAFQEYPSSFPVGNRPVIHVPCVRMNHRTEQDDNQMMWFLRKLDLLIDRRLDRKGVIHSVSYKRARFIADNSRHRERMLVHGSDTRAGTIERFLAADPSTGKILVSPSVDTGYDFAGDRAEYQIICKLPFPDTRGRVMKARCVEDKDYSAYCVAQTMQQMTGRVCRSEADKGETLVLDDNVKWFIPRYRQYFNKWWSESFRAAGSRLPEPLEKL